MSLPDMHCKEEWFEDVEKYNFSDLLMKWFHDEYSTSKHLLTLYSIVLGLKAQNVVEVGFGRSTLIIVSALRLTGGKLYSCDRYDYNSYIPKEYCQIDFTIGDAKTLLKKIDFGVDFVFLDYLSSRERSAESCVKAIYRFLKHLKTNGILAVHDSIESQYNVKNAFKVLKKDKNLEVLSLSYNYGLGLIRNLNKSKYGEIKDGWKKKYPKV